MNAIDASPAVKDAKTEYLVFVLSREGVLRESIGTNPAREEDAEWYVFVYRGATLHPDLPGLLKRHGMRRPDVDIFYGDEAIREEQPQYLLKPSFDRTQLLAQDYIGLPIAVRRRAMRALGGPDLDAGSARFYDLLLRAISVGLEIERITEVLAVNPTSAARATARDRLRALRTFSDDGVAEHEFLPGRIDNTFQICRRFFEYPEVTLIIPTCRGACETGQVDQRGPPMILNLLDSLCQTDWPMERMRVLIGDDLKDDGEYQVTRWPFRLVVTHTGEDGEVRRLNRLWRMAETEQLILVNDDSLVLNPGWVRAMLTFAYDEDVGGVGARLLYPDGRIQHAGVAAGVGPCAHVFIGWSGERTTYQNWADVHREWSMVSARVFATRRSVLELVNGFDERFSLNYSGFDLCLRLRMLGYRIVYTPHAELVYLNDALRGERSAPAEETALFMERWQSFMKDDPAYHPRLTRATSNADPVIEGDEWWNWVVSTSQQGDN